MSDSPLPPVLPYTKPGEGCVCNAWNDTECGCPDVEWGHRAEKLVKLWLEMPSQEMRLRCGEMTSQEIRSVRAVLDAIAREM